MTPARSYLKFNSKEGYHKMYEGEGSMNFLLLFETMSACILLMQNIFWARLQTNDLLQCHIPFQLTSQSFSIIVCWLFGSLFSRSSQNHVSSSVIQVHCPSDDLKKQDCSSMQCHEIYDLKNCIGHMDCMKSINF